MKMGQFVKVDLQPEACSLGFRVQGGLGLGFRGFRVLGYIGEYIGDSTQGLLWVILGV